MILISGIPWMGATVTPSVMMARAVRTAWSAAACLSWWPNLPRAMSSATLKAISLRFMSPSSRILSVIPGGPMSFSMRSAMSWVIWGSGSFTGSRPFALARLATS